MKQRKINLICINCKDTFEIEMIEGLNRINRQEDFGDVILCEDCIPEDPYEEED